MSPRKGLTTVAGFTNLRLLFFFFFNKLLVFQQLYFTNISHYACVPDLPVTEQSGSQQTWMKTPGAALCLLTLQAWFEKCVPGQFCHDLNIPGCAYTNRNGLAYQPSKLYGLAPRLATCKKKNILSCWPSLRPFHDAMFVDPVMWRSHVGCPLVLILPLPTETVWVVLASTVMSTYVKQGG